MIIVTTIIAATIVTTTANNEKTWSDRSVHAPSWRPISPIQTPLQDQISPHLRGYLFPALDPGFGSPVRESRRDGVPP